MSNSTVGHYKDSDKEAFNKKAKEELNEINTLDGNMSLMENPAITLISHDIIVKNKNEEKVSYVHMKNSIAFSFASIEENEKCEFLIKFNDKGNYYIILEADYKIIKKEILDDFSLMKHSGEITIEVVHAFTPKFE